MRFAVDLVNTELGAEKDRLPTQPTGSVTTH